MYVTPGSSVARTPGWSVIVGAGRTVARTCRPEGWAVGGGVADRTGCDVVSATGGWSGADGSFGCVTTYAVAPTNEPAATSTATARSANAFI